MSEKIAAKITGIGGYIPPRLIKNTDLEAMLETSDEWIQQRTGIEQRYWVNDDQSTSDLAYQAALKAIENAKIDVKQIDMIVVATSSPDTDIPGCAAFVQAKLGLTGIPYFDIRQACSGFIYGLSIAQNFISQGSNECVLVIGAEVQSKGLDKTPRGKGVTILFADGAGAVIVQKTKVTQKNDSQILVTKLHAEGSAAKELWMPAPGSAFGPERVTHAMIDEGLIYPQMNGRLVFMNAVTKMPEVLNESLQATKTQLGDVDLHFFHQANMRINQKVCEDMQIPIDKAHTTIHKFGNTTAATIPLGMYDAMQAGKLKPGMLISMVTFGAGFTWASALVRL
ncbi:MAG: 3-oxoacyl-ACP synthase III family protein [Pseudobdellovibrio sp.]